MYLYRVIHSVIKITDLQCALSKNYFTYKKRSTINIRSTLIRRKKIVVGIQLSHPLIFQRFFQQILDISQRRGSFISVFSLFHTVNCVETTLRRNYVVRKRLQSAVHVFFYKKLGSAPSTKSFLISHENFAIIVLKVS